MERLSLRKMVEDKYFIVSPVTVYKYVDRNTNELVEKQIIQIVKRGSRKYIYVIKPKEFKKFFEEKDIYL